MAPGKRPEDEQTIHLCFACFFHPDLFNHSCDPEETGSVRSPAGEGGELSNPDSKIGE
jgi:hypothetical protein